MKFSNAAATGGRIALALIFILSGVGKLAALGTSKAYIQSMGLLLPDLALFGAIAIELLGGLALALGLRTRLAALVLAGFSILTAMIFHAQFADQNQMIHFLKNVAIAGGLLQVAAFGATAFSLDGMFARSGFNRSPIAQSLGRCAGLPTTAARAVGSTDGRGCKAPAPSKRSPSPLRRFRVSWMRQKQNFGQLREADLRRPALTTVCGQKLERS